MQTADIVMLLFLVYGFGLIFMMINTGVRRDCGLRPLKGWEFLIRWAIYPLWFLGWLVCCLALGFWNFLWSDVKP